MAWCFDGAGGVVTIDLASFPNLGGSYCFWLKANSIRKQGLCGMSKNHEILMNKDGNIVHNIQSKNTQVVSDTILNPGVWYHICTTNEVFDDGDPGTDVEARSIFINGVLDEEVVPVQDWGSTRKPFKIGGSSQKSNLDGCLQDFRIYQRTLDPTEVLQIATQGGIDGIDDSLVWRFLFDQNEDPGLGTIQNQGSRSENASVMPVVTASAGPF